LWTLNSLESYYHGICNKFLFQWIGKRTDILSIRTCAKRSDLYSRQSEKQIIWKQNTDIAHWKHCSGWRGAQVVDYLRSDCQVLGSNRRTPKLPTPGSPKSQQQNAAHILSALMDMTPQEVFRFSIHMS
jgi:hypothetical protein